MDCAHVIADGLLGPPRGLTARAGGCGGGSCFGHRLQSMPGAVLHVQAQGLLRAQPGLQRAAHHRPSWFRFPTEAL